MASFEEEIESQITKNKAIVERGKALKRLLNSSDFRNVILSGFLREHALELVYNRAESTAVDDETSRKIDGIAQFKKYLDNVLSDAEFAEKSVEEDSEQLYQSRNEDE